MGKYYTVSRGNLHIYVTEGEELISVNEMPALLGLFEPEAAWSWNQRMITCRDVPEDSLRQAEVILGIYGYRRRKLDEHLLERYFVEWDKDLLLPRGGKPTLTVVPEDQRPSRRRKGAGKVSTGERRRAEARIASMLHELEVARKENRLDEDVYMQEREILEEKLGAHRKVQKERHTQTPREMAGEAAAQETSRIRAPEGERKEGPPTPVSAPAAVSPPVALPEETGVPPKDKARELLMRKLREHLEGGALSPAT